jgi:hypothetical protein
MTNGSNFPSIRTQAVNHAAVRSIRLGTEELFEIGDFARAVEMRAEPALAELMRQGAAVVSWRGLTFVAAGRMRQISATERYGERYC